MARPVGPLGRFEEPGALGDSTQGSSLRRAGAFPTRVQAAAGSFQAVRTVCLLS